MGTRFSLDPSKAIPGKPLPWHKQDLESVMARGLPKDGKSSRLHVKQFPTRLLKQFSSLDKSSDLRKLSTRQRIVTWFGLEILGHRDEMSLLKIARMRFAESEAGKYSSGPVGFSYTPVDTRLHLAKPVMLAISTDPLEEFETLSSELEITRSTLAIWATIAAFSHSRSWIDADLVKICQSELESAIRYAAFHAGVIHATMENTIVVEASPQPAEEEEEGEEND